MTIEEQADNIQQFFFARGARVDKEAFDYLVSEITKVRKEGADEERESSCYQCLRQVPAAGKCDVHDEYVEAAKDWKSPCCGAPWFTSKSTRWGTRLVCNQCGKEKKGSLITNHSEEKI